MSTFLIKCKYSILSIKYMRPNYPFFKIKNEVVTERLIFHK